MKYPTRFQQKTLWSAATGLAMLVLGSLLVGLVWLVGQIFGFLQPVLVPLIVAGIIAYLLDPVVRVVEKRGLSRFWSVITVFLATLIAITLLVAAVIPAIQGGREFFKGLFSTSDPLENVEKVASEVGKATAEISDADLQPVADTATDIDGTVEIQIPTEPESEPDLSPALARSLHNLRSKYKDGPIGWMLTETTDGGEPIAYANGTKSPEALDFFYRTRAGRMLFKYKDEILDTGKKWLSVGSSKFFGFLGLVIGMIMVPVYLFFFLKDSISIREHWHEYVPLRASRFKTELVSTLQEINGYLISFFRGQVVVGVIDGILVGIALFFFDLPYALLIGVFMAILGVIPYIGNILCLIPACIIAYLHAETVKVPFDLDPWPYVGCVVLIFAGVQQINSLFTAPKIVGDSVGLHPLTVIFSMLFWSLILGGFVGALLAVPLSAAVKVIFRRYFWEKTMREPKPASFTP
ncbi:AI-2E family transporter [Luteolibacter algae]|uniref:AI-2E family transporter n=1 Tax=Luteolibacter algae TaxID=454151 RepID=A0ABW5D3R7_9BACT